jgi:hypothetical protein
VSVKDHAVIAGAYLTETSTTAGSYTRETREKVAAAADYLGEKLKYIGNKAASAPAAVYTREKVAAAADCLGEKSKHIGASSKHIGASGTSWFPAAVDAWNAAQAAASAGTAPPPPPTLPPLPLPLAPAPPPPSWFLAAVDAWNAAAADYFDEQCNYLGHKAASATNWLGETFKSTTSLPGPVGEGARALVEGGRVFGRAQTALVLALATSIPVPLPLNSLVNLSVGPALAAVFSFLGIARSRPHIQRLLSVCLPPLPLFPPLPSLPLANLPPQLPRIGLPFAHPSLPPPLPVRCL